MTQRGALEIRDGRVDFERLSKVTSTLISDLVVQQTAGEKGIWDMASVGADGVNGSQSRPHGRSDSTSGVLESLDGRVYFECFQQVFGAL